MRAAGQSEIQTVTLSFEEFAGGAHDEFPLASEVASLYKTNHTTRVITQSEFLDDLPSIFEAMDQPSIDGINTWFVSKAARELGLKVAVSGLGGDELFGGYPSFRDIPRWTRLLAAPSRLPRFGKMLRNLSAPVLAAMGENPKAAGLVEYGAQYAGAYLLRRGLFMPWELKKILDGDTVLEGLRRLSPLRLIEATIAPRPRSPHACVSTLELTLYMRNQLLRDADWASMAHGLEVRVPLVDHILLGRIAHLSNRLHIPLGKNQLAAVARPALPSPVTNRAKTGFLTPIETWQRQSAVIRKMSSQQAAPGPWARNWARAVMSAFA